MNVVVRVTTGPYQGQEYLFDRPAVFVVGRSSQVEFSVPDDGFLSRQHFQIEFDPPLCFLRDLGSTNGTKVNGLRVDGVRLRGGDLIEAGQSTFAIDVDQTDGILKCVGCERSAPSGTQPVPVPGNPRGEWVCPACALERTRFPTAPPGYWIEHRLGGGGMGDVYRARRLADNRPVAIKMMGERVIGDAKARRYFRREMDVLRDLRHPHIVAFYEMAEVDEQVQLIMEYVQGKNAREWTFALPEPLSAPAAARIGMQLLSALDHAHGKGYVHRDVKPSNLLIYGPPSRPTVKLSDFGLAKRFHEDGGLTLLTGQNDIGGSVGFLSPEHIRNFREARESADIYSTGATLFYLLTGQYPYYDFNPNAAEAYAIILEHPALPVRAFRPELPDPLDKILRKSLEKRPGDRWRSAADMAAALAPLLGMTATGSSG